MAYDRIDPFGEWRADLRTATLAALYVNAHRAKGSSPVAIDDFMPKFYQPAPAAPEPDEAVPEVAELQGDQVELDLLMGWVEMLNIGLGGRDLRDKKER